MLLPLSNLFTALFVPMLMSGSGQFPKNTPAQIKIGGMIKKGGLRIDLQPDAKLPPSSVPLRLQFEPEAGKYHAVALNGSEELNRDESLDASPIGLNEPFELVIRSSTLNSSLFDIHLNGMLLKQFPSTVGARDAEIGVRIGHDITYVHLAPLSEDSTFIVDSVRVEPLEFHCAAFFADAASMLGPIASSLEAETDADAATNDANAADMAAAAVGATATDAEEDTVSATESLTRVLFSSSTTPPPAPSSTPVSSPESAAATGDDDDSDKDNAAAAANDTDSSSV